MRKIIFSFLLGASLCTPAFAQLDEDKVVQVGVKGVVSGSWIGNLPTSTQEIEANKDNMKIGFVGGVWIRLRMPITGLFIQPEINFSQQNGKYTYQFVPGGVQPPAGAATTEFGKQVSLNSLEVPLSVGFKMPFGLKISAGGVLNSILSAKQNFQTYTASGGTSTLVSTATEDITSQVKKLQLGLQGGLGVELFKRLNIDFRLQQNLTNIYQGYDSSSVPTNNVNPAQVDQQKQKMFSGQVSIGFRLL